MMFTFSSSVVVALLLTITITITSSFLFNSYRKSTFLFDFIADSQISSIDSSKTHKNPSTNKEKVKTRQLQPPFQDFQNFMNTKILSDDIIGIDNSISNLLIENPNIDISRVLSVISDTCIQCRRLDYASILIDKIPQSSFALGTMKFEDDALYRYINICLSRKCLNFGYDVLLACGEKGIKISIKAVNLLLQGYGKIKNEVFVDKVLMFCHKFGVKVDLIFLHTAMDAYIRCRNFDKALRLFLVIRPEFILQSQHWKMTSSTTHSSSAQFITEDLKIFQNKDNGVLLKPNIRTFNILLKGLKQFGKDSFSYTQDVLVEMKNCNISPDSITINTMVDIGVGAGFLDRAELLLTNSFAEPTVEAYTSLISGYGHQGNILSAFRVLSLMLSKKVMPNSYTLTSLITACLNNLDLVNAQKLIDNDSFLEYLSANEKSAVFGSYICGLCSLSIRHTDMRKKMEFLVLAFERLLDMDRRQILPDTITMNSMLQSICRNHPSGVKTAMLMLEAMSVDRISLDDFTYSILFSALGKEGHADEALHLYRKRARNLDTASLNALIKAFLDGKEPIQAISLFQEFIDIRGGKSSSTINKDTREKQALNFKPCKITFTLQYLALLKCLSTTVKDDREKDDVQLFYEISDYDPVFEYKSRIESNAHNIFEYSPKFAVGKLIQQLMSYDLKNSTMTTTNRNVVLKSSKMKASKEFAIEFYGESLANEMFSPLPIDLKLLNSTKQLVENYKPDDLLRELYRMMRFEFSITPDREMVSALNSLFALDHAFAMSNIWHGFRGFSERTARFIFEDLVILSDYHPSELIPILDECKYSSAKKQDLLTNEAILHKLRASAASFKIFQKHGWNSMESGWNPI